MATPASPSASSPSCGIWAAATSGSVSTPDTATCPEITGARRDIDYGGTFLYELARPELLRTLRANFEELWP